MSHLNSLTYLGLPLFSIISFCVITLLTLVGFYFDFKVLYYGAFMVAFLEFSRLLISYPFDADGIIWILRGVFMFALFFLIPAVFSAYTSGSSDW